MIDALIKMTVDGAMTTVAGVRLDEFCVSLTGDKLQCILLGKGIFKDQQTANVVRKTYVTTENRSFNIVIPDFGTIVGDFIITDLIEHPAASGESGLSISLESTTNVYVKSF
jgi:predicted secreted protein